MFASEEQFPELVNPVQMSFDTKGRLWVAVWKNYPQWQPKTPMDDKLLILEDTNGDGRADKRTVFAGDLANPTGFEFWNGGVIVADQPNVLFLKDTNGDDRYDTREILLHGFDSADSHHAINSFVFDPGGALYMQEGIFHRTQIETPWATVLRQADGGVYRFEPQDVESGHLRPDEFPEPARPRVRRVGTRHHLRRHGRAAVLGAVVLDEEVLPGDGDDEGAAAGTRSHAARRRRGVHHEQPLSGVDAREHDRAERDRVPRAAQLSDGRRRRGTEVRRSRAHPAVGRREFPARGRGDRP